MKRLKLAITILVAIGVVSTGFLASACAPPETPETVVETVEVVVKETVLVEITPIPPPEGKTTLRLAGWGPADASYDAAWEAIETSYEELNPNIDLVLEGLAYEIQRTQLIVMATGGTAPDIGQVDTIIDLELAALGALAPLDDLISPELEADLLPSLLENSMYDGKLYAIPSAPIPHIFWLNTVLAEKAGIDPDVEIETLDDLVDVARTIKALGTDDEGNEIWGLSPDTGWPMIAGLHAFGVMKAFGCDWFDEEGMVTIDSPQCVEAFAWYKDLADEGVLGPPGGGLRETIGSFCQDLSGFGVVGSYMHAMCRYQSPLGEEFDTHWRAVKWPGNPPNPGVAAFYGHSYVIFQQSQHKEEAMKFIEWVVSDPDIYRLYFDASGAPPPTLSLLEGDPYYDLPWIHTVVEQMDSWERAVAFNPPKFNDVAVFIGNGVTKVVVAGADPQTVADDVAANLRLLFGQ